MGAAVRYQEAVARLKAGAVLHRCFPSGPADSERFELMPCGGYVTAATLGRLEGALVPDALGLFVEMPAQSYRWAGDERD